MRYDSQGEWVPPKFTQHAAKRRKEMGLSVDDVLVVVADCDVSYQQDDYDNNGTVFKRDDVTVVVDETNNTIITVLWNRQEDYKR